MVGLCCGSSLFLQFFGLMCQLEGIENVVAQMVFFNQVVGIELFFPLFLWFVG